MSCPLFLQRRRPAGTSPQYRPPTPVLRADPSRPALPHPAQPTRLNALSRPYVFGPEAAHYGTPERPILEATGRPAPMPVWQAEWLRWTLSGERPAGLRTTRAEQSEARTTLLLSSSSSVRI